MTAISNKDSRGRQSLRWFLVISLFLHLLFMIFFGWSSGFEFLEAAPVDQQQDRDVVFELAETPLESNTETAPENARLFSDKNMAARNEQRTEALGDTPFNPGNSEFPEVPQAQAQPEVMEEETKAREETEETAKEQLSSDAEATRFVAKPTRKFSRDALLGKQASPPSSRPRKGIDNKQFSVDDLGGFAFNTYNWNFAPYMLYLKRRIEQHIFPPPAFSKMGIIEGRSVLRFLIDRDGGLIRVEVLDSQGHKALLFTSENAVKGSSPFKPLPSDFPEDFLEVTGTFVYTIER